MFVQTKVQEGGLVPKGLYLTEGEMEREGGNMVDDSIYHSVSLAKGQVPAVRIHFISTCLKTNTTYNLTYIIYFIFVCIALVLGMCACYITISFCILP